MTGASDLPFFDPVSPTAGIVEQLELHGYRPTPGEPDPRPAPDEIAIEAGLTEVFDAIVVMLAGTCLETELDDLLWSTTNLFHRAGDRIARSLDLNEGAQHRSQQEQDGSEVRSVELERLLDHGQVLIERRDALQTMRDRAAELYEAHTGSSWRPRTGSLVNHRALTATVVDSRDFLQAKRRVETQVLLPPGSKVAFAGGVDCNDHHAIWTALDKVHAKHSTMVLLHGGSPKGAELIAAKWADARRVSQITFKPDWARHAKAAPFKRNDALLDTLPIGVVVFPGSGISDNLADKARKLGIPLFDFRKKGGG